MKLVCVSLALATSLLCASCGQPGEENVDGKKDGGGDGGASAADATGFETPEAALKTYGAAMISGDEATYRKIAARNTDAIEGLDAIIHYETGMSPAEAAKINLQALAEIQGFTKTFAKRFPAEVTGNKGRIVHVFEDTGLFALEDKYRIWNFEKYGGKWCLVGSDFGEAAKLPEKYRWHKGIADVSQPMQQFLAGWDGTSEKVEAVLEEFAAGIDADGMDNFGLDQPVVIMREEQDGMVCYTMNTVAGSTRRKFVVCWKDDKIVSIKDISIPDMPTS